MTDLLKSEVGILMRRANGIAPVRHLISNCHYAYTFLRSYYKPSIIPKIAIYVILKPDTRNLKTRLLAPKVLNAIDNSFLSKSINYNFGFSFSARVSPRILKQSTVNARARPG